MIVKPNTQGSSVGITKVCSAPKSCPPRTRGARYEPDVFAEAFIAAAEYSVPVLQGEALPSIRIRSTQTIYVTRPSIPRRHPLTNARRPVQPAEKHLAIRPGGLRGRGRQRLGRVDFMLDASGRPLLLEPTPFRDEPTTAGCRWARAPRHRFR